MPGTRERGVRAVAGDGNPYYAFCHYLVFPIRGKSPVGGPPRALRVTKRRPLVAPLDMGFIARIRSRRGMEVNHKGAKPAQRTPPLRILASLR
jgi:hypothetical protein